MLRSVMATATSVFIFGLLTASSLHAQLIDSKSVETSINLGVAFLLDKQLNDGGWPNYADYPGGVTGLATLALLNSGLSPDDPRVSRALQNLSGQELFKTYTVALQTMAFCAANPNKYAQSILRNTQWLIDEQLPNGGWGYGQGGGGSGDPSNSQFALLALHEAQRAGTKLPDSEWRKVFGKARNYWVNVQNKDGSFSYSSGDQPRGSITCGGIASLVIVGSQLDFLENSGRDRIECCGAESSNQNRIEEGLDWMARNFTVVNNPVYRQHHLYYMYALERVGRLTGRRFIGDHDWYREGAATLVLLQDPATGKFRSSIQTSLGNDYTETAFALLFLAKGKRQTIVNRLRYRTFKNDWDIHPTAIQHLTAHTEQAWKRDLSWQNIDISRSSVQDLLDTPVLFISGTSSPAFTRNQKQLLKEYVEQGGFIFAEGCIGDGCNGQEFEEYFRKLVVELFEQPLEKLSPDHPLWYAESRVLPKDLPPGAWLYGVQTCCRLGVVYVPYSLSCRWELNLPYGIKPVFPEAVQADLDTATKIGINVLAYATGKELKEKLDTVTVLEDVVNRAPTDRNVFILPKLRHNAGADDAPRSIPQNLMQWLDKTNPFMLSDEKRLINIATDELLQYPVVFMHGRGKLQLSDKQREALRTYLGNGGFLFADAICGDVDFAESFRREMQLILDEPLALIAESHPLFTDKYYGFNIETVRIIDPDQSGDSIIAAQRTIRPRLEGAKVENRLAVVFSPLDLSCALESRHSLQCRGYVRDDAARIGINILLFALQQ